MSINKIISFLLLYLIVLSKAQDVDKDLLRAVACLSMIRKLENRPNDPQSISSYMLTCFISIDDSTTQKLIANQNSNTLDLDEKQLKKLTDFYDVQSRFTEDQIMEYSKDLNSALEKLKNFSPEAMKQQGGHTSAEKPRNKKNQGKSLFKIMISNIIGLFNANDSLIGLFVILFVCYLILKQLRKWCGSDNKNKITSNKNNKKKVS